MVMIYLKVFSWWRRVKAGRRASRQHETPLSQLDQPRFDPPIYASHPDPNEYVVLVFVDGVRDLPKSAQIKLLVAECGEDSTETQLSKECSANIILHAATTASDLTVGILGSNDSDVFSARIAMPLPSAPEDFSYRAEWHSSDIGSGQLRASVLKLKFRDLARVTSSFSKSRAPGDDSSQLEQMVEKLQSVLASTNNESFQELGRCWGSLWIKLTKTAAAFQALKHAWRNSSVKTQLFKTRIGASRSFDQAIPQLRCSRMTFKPLCW
jgi:hypothetical protein